MPQLFSTAPKFDPHVTSIVKLMLGRLRNNHPAEDSKLFVRTANWVVDIYEGRATRHHFTDMNIRQYNLDGWSEKLLACKGDWSKVRSIIIDSISHLEMAKDKSYMPFNKKYLNGITFSNFFECYSRSGYGEIDSPFVKFINEPLRSKSYKTMLADERIISELEPFVRNPAVSFCDFNYKSDGIKKHYFWLNVSEINTWLVNFKSDMAKVYSSFIMACDDANPMQDFINWARTKYQLKYGVMARLEPWVFRIHKDDEDEVTGDFKEWLEHGKRSGKFAMLRDGQTRNENKPTEKEVIDIDELPIF